MAVISAARIHRAKSEIIQVKARHRRTSPASPLSNRIDEPDYALVPGSFEFKATGQRHVTLNRRELHAPVELLVPPEQRVQHLNIHRLCVAWRIEKTFYSPPVSRPSRPSFQREPQIQILPDSSPHISRPALSPRPDDRES